MPATLTCNMHAARRMKVVSSPYVSRLYLMTGGNTNDPMPAPQNEMPLANARLLSKYCPRMTILGA